MIFRELTIFYERINQWCSTAAAPLTYEFIYICFNITHHLSYCYPNRGSSTYRTFLWIGKATTSRETKRLQKGAGQGPFLKTLWIITLLPSVLEQKWKSKVLMNNYFLRAWGLPMLWRTNGRNALGSLRRNLQCSLSILQSAVVACMTLKLEVGDHGAGRGRQGCFCIFFDASCAHTWHFVGTSTAHLST